MSREGHVFVRDLKRPTFILQADPWHRDHQKRKGKENKEPQNQKTAKLGEGGESHFES